MGDAGVGQDRLTTEMDGIEVAAQEVEIRMTKQICLFQGAIQGMCLMFK